MPELARVLEYLRRAGRSVVFLAGDSTLDNKAWIGTGTVPASEPYARALLPKTQLPDVAYWLTEALDGHAALNCAVEEATVGGGNTEHSRFVREHIGPDDVLVLSIGGNDIALRPSPETTQYLGALVAMVRDDEPIPRGHPALEYLRRLLGYEVQRLAEWMCGETCPAMVVVCAPYHPCTDASQQSWADPALLQLKYDADPSVLQRVQRLVYEHATKSVRVAGTTTVHLPLYEALDPNDPSDYSARVEPSRTGGRKIADR